MFAGQPAAFRSIEPTFRSVLGVLAVLEPLAPPLQAVRATVAMATDANAATRLEVRCMTSRFLLWSAGMVRGGAVVRKEGLGGGGLVPLADGELLEPAEEGEDGDAEEGGGEDRREQLRSLQPGGVVGEQGSEAGRAAPEEEVPDDGTHDGEARGDPHAGEDRGHRGRQLQLGQHRPA